MDSINEITYEQVSRLQATQLVILLGMLLTNEASRYKLDIEQLNVPENITTPDGGEDGRIIWRGKPQNTRWLQNRFTIFQSKATDLSPAACFNEILIPEKEAAARELKPQVKEAVERGGSYILFTTQALNPNLKNARITEFRKAIEVAGHANYASFQILIYDAEDIKNWVNEYTASVTYVQKCVGIYRPLGFVIWEEWQNKMKIDEVPYVSNDVLNGYIDQIRTELFEGKGVRIIGHSGLGKTRLALEVFRSDASNLEVNAMRANVVYYDIGSVNIESIRNYIISHKDNQAGILVIDNCSENYSSELFSLVRTSGNFKLITIDFSNSSEERSLIRLDRNDQKSIIGKIVEEKIGNSLSPTDKDYIANQSEGYPQMAILFCDLVIDEGFSNLNSILPGKFIEKLVFGRGVPNDLEFSVIMGAAVLSSFPFIDDPFRDALDKTERQEFELQTEYVRTKICHHVAGREIEKGEFFRAIKKFKEEAKLMEQRGTQIMVKPTPLAISLAIRWWQNTPIDDIRLIIGELKEKVIGTKMVERLRELDQLNKAVALVNELWGPKSPFGTAEVLNTSLGSLLFRYVVEVNPEATVRTLENVFGKMSKKELLKFTEGRRNIVWALEKLCFRKEIFRSASKILYLLAVAENERWGNNATNQFVQLFQIYLPGTEAPLMQRLETIRWGLNFTDSDFTRIAISALGRGLVYDNFTRMGGAEVQGSKSPLHDYNPRDWKEIDDYWNEIINILLEISNGNTELSSFARSQILNSIRSLIREGQNELVTRALKTIINSDPSLWAEATGNLRKALGQRFDIDDQTRNQIGELIKDLTPQDLKSELYLKVTKSQWESYDKDEKGHYIDHGKIAVEDLAVRLVKENTSIEKYLPDLLIDSQAQGYAFGKKLGEIVKNKSSFIDQALSALISIQKGNQNPELIAGFLAGAGDKELSKNMVEKFIKTPELNQLAFYLVRSIEFDFSMINMLFSLVDSKHITISQFINFKYGRALDILERSQVIELCEKIAKYGKEGIWTSLSLLYMYSFNDEERWSAVKKSLRILIITENLIINNSGVGTIDAYHWSHTIEKLLLDSDDKELALITSRQILEFCVEGNFNYNFESYVASVVRALFEKYFSITWQLFGEALMGDYMHYFHLKHLIGSRNGYPDSFVGLAFEKEENWKDILEWCKAFPEAPRRLAGMMPVNSVSGNWHPFSNSIIDQYGSDTNVITALDANMGTYGTVGSSIPYFEMQKGLLESLINHPIDLVAQWAKDKLLITDKLIVRENLSNEERFL